MGQRSDADFMVDEIPEETRQKARNTVAQTAVRLGADAADTRRVLELLGLADTPQREAGACPVCGKELPATAHSPKYGLAGTCSRTCRKLKESGQKYVPPRLTCLDCGKRMVTKPDKGEVLRGSRERCSRCHKRHLRPPVTCVCACGDEFSTTTGATQCTPCKKGLVSAAPAREYLLKLRPFATWDQLHEATGVARAALGRIAGGSTKRIQLGTERAILSATGIGTAARA